MTGRSWGRSLATRALFEIGVCLERMGKAKEAIQALQWILDAFPDEKEIAIRARAKLGREEETHGDAAIEEKLRTTILNEEFVNPDVDSVIDTIRERTRLNLIIDEQASALVVGKGFTIHLWGGRVADAIDRVLGPLGIAWRVIEGCVVLTPRESHRGPSQQPLLDIARWFQDRTQVPFVVDEASIPGLATRRVTFRADGIPANAALSLVLKVPDLDWYVDREVVHITSREGAVAWRKAREAEPSPR